MFLKAPPYVCRLREMVGLGKLQFTLVELTFCSTFCRAVSLELIWLGHTLLSMHLWNRSLNTSFGAKLAIMPSPTFLLLYWSEWEKEHKRFKQCKIHFRVLDLISWTWGLVGNASYHCTLCRSRVQLLNSQILVQLWPSKLVPIYLDPGCNLLATELIIFSQCLRKARASFSISKSNWLKVRRE